MLLEYILCAGWAFFIAVFAIPSIIQVAHNKNLLDMPNNRTVHELHTPRLGGLAIFAGFVSALTIFGDITRSIQELLAGCILIFFIGLKDDIVSVSAFKKFFVQVLAAGIIIFIGDVRVSSFHGFFGINDLPPGISYAFSFLMIIGITNAFNLIDGIDGLAGSLVVLVCLTLGFSFHFAGNANSAGYEIVAFSLAGSVMGFLRYNIHKAIVFMGDSGSLICGFIIAVLLIQFIELDFVENTPGIAIGMVFVPLLDTIRVFFMRIMKGLSPFSPDKNHLHHIMVGFGISQSMTIMILVAINILAIAFVFSFYYLGINYVVGGLIILGLFISVLVKMLVKRQEI